MRALDLEVPDQTIDDFYRLSRAVLVKDERHLDAFDVAFAQVFKGILSVSQAVEAAEIPEEWLKQADRALSFAGRARRTEKLGFDKLMETLRQRLAEQKGRHQGGSKWIGTGGTSPFGAFGDNPEGVRIGQDRGRRGSAIKVWDKREFKDFSGAEELGPRNIRIALAALAKVRARRSGRGARPRRHHPLHRRQGLYRRQAAPRAAQCGQGAAVPRRRRLDGLAHREADALFSAARLQFKRLEHFYFHNCVYESVWRNNRRRFEERTPDRRPHQPLWTDHRVIFVGDAAMSPYEITAPGGSVEHLNPESGETWLKRVATTWPRSVWINPTPQDQWRYSQSAGIISALFGGRMFALTPDGVEAAMRALAH